MTTLVLREDFIVAKGKLSEMILANDRGMIMGSLLLRLEMDSDDVKEWVNRRCSLHDDRIEISDAKTGLLLTEIDLLKYEIKMLDGFAFSLRKIDGSSCVIFDADSKETRRRWLTSITYQMAVRGPLMDFAPFPYAPPVGDTTSRVILCGYLLKQQVKTFSWNYKFFKLTSSELQYFTNTKKKVLKVRKGNKNRNNSIYFIIFLSLLRNIFCQIEPPFLSLMQYSYVSFLVGWCDNCER